MNRTYVTQLHSLLIGPLRIETTETHLISIQFQKTQRRDQLDFLDEVCKKLEDYFKGELKDFDIPLELSGTEFQKKCWNILIQIPYAETRSYKEEAELIGGANYARAVAGANNKNKIPIIIPCHRIIGHDGSLVGYAGGVKIKKILLELEKDAGRERGVRHRLHKRERT